MPNTSRYLLASEHQEHRRPALLDAIEYSGAYLLKRSVGGLAVRYVCPDCNVLLEHAVSGANPGLIMSFFIAKGIPIQNEYNPPPIHEEMGL